jgi:hypothetical protein
LRQFLCTPGASAVKLVRRIAAELKALTSVERFMLLATVVGLGADSIALLSYVNIVVAPPQGHLGQSGSDAFFVWMAIALIYSLGLINSYLYRRWDESFRARRYLATRSRGWPRPHITNEFVQRLLIAGLTSFPFIVVYMHAIGDELVLAEGRPFSEWHALYFAFGAAFGVVPLVATAGYAFDILIMTLLPHDR